MVVVIGVAGGANSGKKTVCNRIVEQLGRDASIAVLSMDSFYRSLTAEEQVRVQRGEYSFDHPQAFDFERLEAVLHKLINHGSVEIPVYDYHERRCTSKSHLQEPVDVILLEGMLVLYHAAVRDLLSMKIFVDMDSDSRLSRRVIRDTGRFSRSLDSVLIEYTRFVKPCFEDFVLPTKKRADIVIPRGPENSVAVDIIIHYIRDLLQQSIQPIDQTIYNRNTIQSDIVLDSRPVYTTAGTEINDESKT